MCQTYGWQLYRNMLTSFYKTKLHENVSAFLKRACAYFCWQRLKIKIVGKQPEIPFASNSPALITNKIHNYL